ncbi:MAG: glycerophosphodiester phosphodiesterase [Bacteroidota bacterium]|nr:glycerophosphodiester phosphodiesterase [Bacteroidota bacterium]
MKKIILPISLLLIFGCMGNRKLNHSSLGVGGFDFEGHRGCRGLMPENTIPAFKKAIDLHVTTLEMDAVITKDKQVIISHEPFFNHEITTKPDGSFVNEKDERSLNIYKMDYAETQTYDVGSKPHPRFPDQQKLSVHKPRLADVIDSAEAYTARLSLHPIQYNIETKSTPATDGIYHPNPDEFVELIMAIIKEKKIEERVIIQSFDIRTLQYLHQHYPTIKTAYLFEPPSDKSFAVRLKELGFIPTIYSPDESLVTALLVKQCKELGMKLIPWTVDDLKRMKELKQMGVDGLISDYPNLYAELFSK